MQVQIFFSPSLDIWLHRVIVQSLLLPFKISHWKKVECLPMFTLHGRQIDSADREAPILELSQDSSSTEVEEGGIQDGVRIDKGSVHGLQRDSSRSKKDWRSAKGGERRKINNIDLEWKQNDRTSESSSCGSDS